MPFLAVTNYSEMYNRRNEKIFGTKNAKLEWGGYFKDKLCRQDVYIWSVFIKLNTGKT